MNTEAQQPIHTRDYARLVLRNAVQSAYDFQKERINFGNRLVQNYKVKLGQDPGSSEADLTPEAKKILADLRTDYRRIADAYAERRQAQRKSPAVGKNTRKTGLPPLNTFRPDGTITDYAELIMVHDYSNMLDAEETAFDAVAQLVEAHPIGPWLLGIRGVGPSMAGVLLGFFDIYKADTVSKFWKYAGYDVASDGRGRSRRAEHLVEREYVDKGGKTKTRRGITFNPFVKTKLHVLAESFIKSGSEYRQIYDNCKHRLEHHDVYGTHRDAERIAEAADNERKYAPKLHRHLMARRYMIKMFLADLYVAWRTVEGLPVRSPYAEEKLGRMPHSAGAGK